MITREQILKTSINKYGIEPQINQLVEEIGELLQAINKLRRKGTESGIIDNFSFKIYIPEPGEKALVDYALAYGALCGEVADVQITLDQLKLMLNMETINLSEVRKIERLKAKLGL